MQSIKRSVLLSLTVSFSFLSKIKWGSTLTEVYIRAAFQMLCWTTGDLLSHKGWEVLIFIDDQFPLFLQAHRLQGGLSCSEGRWKHCYRRWHSDTGVFVCEQMFIHLHVWLSLVSNRRWMVSLCSYSFCPRWCWTAQLSPASCTCSVAPRNPSGRKPAGPSPTSQRETERRFRYTMTHTPHLLPRGTLAGLSLFIMCGRVTRLWPQTLKRVNLFVVST